MWLNIIKLSIAELVALLCFTACINGSITQDRQGVEEAYLTEVVQRRIQGRQLIDLGLRSSTDKNCTKVLQAMAHYYDNTNCLFVSLAKDYPALATLDPDSDLEYIQISDIEMVDLLQTHVYATLNLYKGGVMMGTLNDKYKHNLLLLMPALAEQNEDLKVLQNRNGARQFVSGD